MFKNTSGQKLSVFAFDAVTNLPKTGDAAQMSAFVNKDHAGVNALADTSAAEDSSGNAAGYYTFDLTQGETNGNKLIFSAKSSTPNVVCIAEPRVAYTLPPNFGNLGIDGSGNVAGTGLTTDQGDQLQAVFDKLPPENLPGAGQDYPTLQEIGDVLTQGVTDITAAIGTIGSGGTTQPRVNHPAGPAYQLTVSRRADGTHKATRQGLPVRIRSGAVGAKAISLDMSSLYGPSDYVQTVGDPEVSAGDITATALGPRDTTAMVQLGGTANGQVVTVSQLVTMESGESELVTFDVEPLAD